MSTYFFPKLITHTNNNQLYLNNILRISFKMDIIVASDNNLIVSYNDHYISKIQKLFLVSNFILLSLFEIWAVFFNVRYVHLYTHTSTQCRKIN